MKENFNNQKIKSLIKEGKPAKHAVGNGLYFRVTAEHVGFWIVRYSINSKRREMSLGQFPVTTLAIATAQAAQIKLGVKQGIDPIAERDRGDKTRLQSVNDLAEDWLAECDKRLKHPNIPRRVYIKDIAPVIGGLSIERVNPRDIRAIIQRVVDSNRPTIANDCLLYCKRLFRHAVKLDLRTSNPAEAFSLNDAGGAEKSRTRALSLKELEQVFEVFRNNTDQFARENYLATALLVVLGVRKVELIGAKWEEFDFDKALWQLPKERSKMGETLTIPLPPQVIEWLKELQTRSHGKEYVFPKRRASQRQGHMSADTLNAAIGKLFQQGKMPVPHFTIHDLRRTCRSLLASQGVPAHIAERCLNHKIKGVEGIYDRYDYLDERREALNKIAFLLKPLTT